MTKSPARASSVFSLLLLVAVTFNLHAQTLNKLIYLADDSQPLNYVQGNELKGLAFDLLEATTAQAGSPVQRTDVRILPWARAYRQAIRGPNRVLFSMYRMPNREKLFKWAGPFATNTLALTAKKSRSIKINNLADLDNYTIGVQREDAAEHYLRTLDLDRMKVTQVVLAQQGARMLENDRIALWAGGEGGILSNLAAIGVDPNEYETVGILQEFKLYFGFSRDVDDALVQQFQTALDQVLTRRANPSDSPE